MSSIPDTTRLRYVRARRPDQIEAFLTNIGIRVEIKGSPQWDGKKWTLWFIPPDDKRQDVKSQEL